MARQISASQAKAQLSALIAEVAHGGAPVIIERHGRPVAALVGLDDLARITRETPTARPRGALALVGAWSDVGDDAVEAFTAEIYAQRQADVARPVELAG